MGLRSDYNPFANLDLHIPKACLEDVKRFTTTQGGEGGTSEESAPFMRYVDIWATAVAVGAEEGVYVSTTDQHRFIQGAILQGDLARIEFLQLIAIAQSLDPYVVTDSKRVIEIADAFAAGGLPIVIDWLQGGGGGSSPIMSVTKNIYKFLVEKGEDREARIDPAEG